MTVRIEHLALGFNGLNTITLEHLVDLRHDHLDTFQKRLIIFVFGLRRFDGSFQIVEDA